MQVLIIGNGGREHALAWKVAQSGKVSQVFVAPGNAGTSLEPKVCNVPIDPSDIEGLLQFAQSKSIELTIVGPEIPLVAGIVDRFNEAGLRCFGPTQKAAQLEGSKAFAKDFLHRYQIPTAKYQVFEEYNAAYQYLEKESFPLVIKADGLAAGKGVVIVQSIQEGKAILESIFDKKIFGAAGNRVVIEEFLRGEELSYIVMVDGEHILPFASSQDHKARDNQDKGPNTGGMGAYSPAPILNDNLEKIILNNIIYPTLSGLKNEGISYTGFLYAGLMIDDEGPKVLEFNCRLGDPETEVILPRLKSDLVTLIEAALNGKLNTEVADWDEDAAVGVVLTAKGYPENYEKGKIISGLDTARLDIMESNNKFKGKVFHAGTRLEKGKVLTSGGRVLCVTGLGSTVTKAQQIAYEMAKNIHWEDIYFRTDIGYRAINREAMAFN